MENGFYQHNAASSAYRRLLRPLQKYPQPSSLQYPDAEPVNGYRSEYLGFKLIVFEHTLTGEGFGKHLAEIIGRCKTFSTTLFLGKGITFLEPRAQHVVFHLKKARKPLI